MQYPIFRKYVNNKHYFCIKNATEVEELYLNGKQWQMNKWEIKTFADRNQLQYILENNGFVESILKKEYDEILALLA